MVSVLCCGPCFDDAITEDDTLYNFLDSLLEYHDPKVFYFWLRSEYWTAEMRIHLNVLNISTSVWVVRNPNALLDNLKIIETKSSRHVTYIF